MVDFRSGLNIRWVGVNNENDKAVATGSRMEVVQQENEVVTIGRRSRIEERSDERNISKLVS